MNKTVFSLLALSFSFAWGGQAIAAPSANNMSEPLVQFYAKQIFTESSASGMAMMVIDGDQRLFTSEGETRPGNHQPPQKESLFRIASLTKLLTSETLIKLEQQGKLKINDPLSRYAPAGTRIPSYQGAPIRLQHLATHSAGLPRELPGGKPNRPVFVWPQRATRWHWLAHARLRTQPGTAAAYSNLGYDLLADALARAGGQPYPQLLRQLVTRPLGMKDTTFTPSPEQCRRLMVPRTAASPCNNTLAAIGSGGLYSTSDDMGRWMQQFLSSRLHPRTPLATHLQKVFYRREQLSSLTGMDVAGRASGLGLGWVHLAAADESPAMIQKTGGGGGFMTYIAMVPESNIGVFVVVSRTASSRFKPMSNGVNNLVTALVHQRHRQ